MEIVKLKGTAYAIAASSALRTAVECFVGICGMLLLAYLKEQDFHSCGTLNSGSICILFITLNMAIMS